ncbi:MAG: hypothetical protein ABIM30_00675 [candidate division WOR-3 bacterium]
MKKVLLTSLPLYGTTIGEYSGEELPKNGNPYKIEKCYSVVVAPDGRIGLAPVKEVFMLSEDTIETNCQYIVVNENSPLMNAYTSSLSKIVLPRTHGKIIT